MTPLLLLVIVVTLSLVVVNFGCTVELHETGCVCVDFDHVLDREEAAGVEPDGHFLRHGHGLESVLEQAELVLGGDGVIDLEGVDNVRVEGHLHRVVGHDGAGGGHGQRLGSRAGGQLQVVRLGVKLAQDGA